MKILITGGAGYIGSHAIIELMKSTDWELFSIDDYRNSGPESYDRIKKITSRPIPFAEVDICNIDSLRKVFKEQNFDGVMHFAAMKAVGESIDIPGTYYHNNLIGLINILKMHDDFNVKHHIYSSSCTVYGASDVLPVSESNPSGKAESPYGWTKVMGEQILKDMTKDGRTFKSLALRYFNPVGAHTSGLIGELPKGTPNNLVPYITQTAAGIRPVMTIHGNDYDTPDGTCIRDYVHVSDIAAAHVSAMKYLVEGKQELPYDFINLGTGNGVTVKELVDAFIRVNKTELPHTYGPRRAGDVVSMFADNSKAAKLLNWRPERDMDEMMRSAWAWQKELMAQSL